MCKEKWILGLTKPCHAFFRDRTGFPLAPVIHMAKVAGIGAGRTFLGGGGGGGGSAPASSGAGLDLSVSR